MSLMDLYGGKQTFGVDPQTQEAVNTYAAMPPAPEQKKGGGLGEVLKTLFAGALDGVARHYGFEPGGLNMMKHRMAQEEERKSLMEKLMAERDNYVWKKGVDQQFAGPPELPADVRSAEWYRGASPEQRANWDRLHSQLLALQQGGAVARVTPGGQAQLVVTPNPGGNQTGAPASAPKVIGGKTYQQDANGDWYEVGGGVSNGPGGFRF